MNNMECVVAVLASHREARHWSDEAVALDLLAQLGLDAQGEAKHAAPVIDPNMVTEDQVVAAEAAAKEATDKARAAREALDAQTKTDAQTDAEAKAEAADQARVAGENREAQALKDRTAADAADGSTKRGRGSQG